MPRARRFYKSRCDYQGMNFPPTQIVPGRSVSSFKVRVPVGTEAGDKSASIQNCFRYLPYKVRIVQMFNHMGSKEAADTRNLLDRRDAAATKFNARIIRTRLANFVRKNVITSAGQLPASIAPRRTEIEDGVTGLKPKIAKYLDISREVSLGSPKTICNQFRESLIRRTVRSKSLRVGLLVKRIRLFRAAFGSPEPQAALGAFIEGCDQVLPANESRSARSASWAFVIRIMSRRPCQILSFFQDGKCHAS